jgi:hypothetical protein
MGEILLDLYVHFEGTIENPMGQWLFFTWEIHEHPLKKQGALSWLHWGCCLVFHQPYYDSTPW